MIIFLFYCCMILSVEIELQNLVFYKNVKDMYIYITLN